MKCSSAVFLYPLHIYHAGQRSPAFANLRSHGIQPELVLLNTTGHIDASVYFFRDPFPADPST